MPPPSDELPGLPVRLLLSHPKTLIALLLGALVFWGVQARHFELDASAEALLVEDDPDLQLFRQVSARYQTPDLLIVTFTSEGWLFEDANLGRLRALRDELAELPGVDSVTSILDVPLVESSDVPLLEMAGNLQRLESESVDRERAIEELTGSPVFKDLVISEDGRTTAILLNLTRDQTFSALLEKRNELLIRRSRQGPDPEIARELRALRPVYEEASDRLGEAQHHTIAAVREVLEHHREHTRLHLGGVPMIADDMISFVRRDLIVFGACVGVFLIAVLTVIFRELRWVVLPLLSCIYASVTMIGLLGFVGWEVTVISSNFLALMLIMTLSMNIHLTVRYRQLVAESTAGTQAELVAATLQRMVWPCLYTALTTIIGFGSLVVSGIKPVRDFGLMMSLGLCVVFLTSFTLYPAVLAMLPARGEESRRREIGLMSILSRLTERHGTAILVASLLLAVFGAVGISRLVVENSFIDYFRADTEIYQGMKLIDDELGGTTPLDVLLSFRIDPPDAEGAAPTSEEEDPWLFDLEEEERPSSWFTPFKIERIKAVHDAIEALPEVGKVLSLASGIRVAEKLNEGKEFDGVELALLYEKLPDEVRASLIDPYVSIDDDEARISLRILDSRPGLRRDELVRKIRAELEDGLGLDPGKFRLVGTLILYNNMLQSLFGSQIQSLGAVMAGIAAMLLVLFRNVRLAVIGIVPNLLAAAVVLGLMGWIGIPLDVMTITIAAITIGIAVDNGIHYIYRFREEFAKCGDYAKTLHICHANIGRAVFYTSATVIFGFSTLVLSSFVPTITFGLLTGLAMAIAFLASLTLLPKLILLWKPFGVGNGSETS